MQFAEQWIHHVVARVSDAFGEKISKIFGVDVVVPETPFPRITMSDAFGMLVEKGHINERDGDLDPAGERLLCQHVLQEYGHEFVFVTDYPISVRPFYHMRQEGNPSLTRSFDLLWKGLEITTGAQREHRLDRLETQATEKGLDLEHIRFYLDFFRYGCPPHGGFGFGLTRVLMVLLGLSAVRDTTFLVRTPNRLTP
jgi:aspartyl/asparaginyl-tRNA synthetase